MPRRRMLFCVSRFVFNRKSDSSNNDIQGLGFVVLARAFAPLRPRSMQTEGSVLETGTGGLVVPEAQQELGPGRE